MRRCQTEPDGKAKVWRVEDGSWQVDIGTICRTCMSCSFVMVDDEPTWEAAMASARAEMAKFAPAEHREASQDEGGRES